MKKQYTLIIILLACSFTTRVLCGIFSGAANADAGDYTTLAIQIAKSNAYSYIIDTNSGRQIFQLWLLILTLMMELIGATNYSAILTVSLFGTLSVFLYYKTLHLFFEHTDSLIITILYAFYPLIISTQQNPLYDGFMLFLIISTGYFYFTFLRNNNLQSLIISSAIATLLPFVHPSGYIYLFLFTISLPFFYRKNNRTKIWMLFSIFAWVFPVVQILIWKSIFGEFLPYSTIGSDWQALNARGFNQPHDFLSTVSLILIYILTISPLIVIALIIFILDVNTIIKRKQKFVILFILAVVLILFLLDKALIATLFAIYAFMVMFKVRLLKENKLVFFSGALVLTLLAIFIWMHDNIAPQSRGFSYIVAFSLPLLWYYGIRIIKDKKILKYGLFIFYLLSCSISIYFNLPANKDQKLPYFNKRISVALNSYLPFYKQPSKVIQSLKFIQEQNFNPESYIFTNFQDRFLPANLNMAQNHCLIATGESYSIDKGFEEVKLEMYTNWIRTNMPEYIVWDKKLHDQSYNIIDLNGKRKMSFSYKQFFDEINHDYFINKVVKDSVLIFRRIY